MSAAFQTSTLAEAFESAGLALPDGASTGCLVRFSSSDNPADTSGWLSILADGAGAAFGCLRSGRSFAWVQNRGGAGAPDAAEIKRTLARVALAQAEAIGKPAERASAPDAYAANTMHDQLGQLAERASAPDAYAALPATMREAQRWLVWRSVPNQDDPSKKPRKVPFYASGQARGATDTPADSANLSHLEAALLALKTGKFTGLGFALGADGTGKHWQGVDLDQLSAHPELTDVAASLPGFTETSPSGDGLHAIGYGLPFASMGSNASGIEAYSAGRYFTVTAAKIGTGSPVCLADFVNERLRPMHGGKRAGEILAKAGEDETPFEMVNPDTVTHLRSALLFMRSDDRDLWVKCGLALKALGDTGRGLWLEWSATSEKFDPSEAAQTWESFKPDRTGYKAVFKLSQAKGWVNPTSRAGRKASKRDFSASVFADATDTLPAAGAFPVPSLGGADERDGTASTRALTEYGNALRMLDTHGEAIRFIPELKSWLVFQDGAWHSGTARVNELAAELAYAVYAEGARFRIDAAESFAKWARSSQKGQTVRNTVQMLSDASAVRLPLMLVDANLWQVGFDQARQVLDLRTGRARPAAACDYITKSLTPCALGDASKAVRWQGFLEQVFDGDAELISWLQRWCGYLLTGDVSESIILFFFGLGANGKSVFAEVLRHVLGDYGGVIPTELLTESKKQAGGASPDLAALVGKRLALSSETEEGRPLAESLLKSLTGGDSVPCRAPYGMPFNFTPAFKLLILGNHKPTIRGTDVGIWRRLRLVPFNHTFIGKAADPLLISKLKDEAPHILAWMVRGCLDWQVQRLADVPEIVKTQTADYRKDQDITGRWLDESVLFTEGAEIRKSDLYQNYQNWAISNGLKPVSNVLLARRLAERGVIDRISHSAKWWCGISLKPNNHEGYSQFV